MGKARKGLELSPLGVGKGWIQGWVDKCVKVHMGGQVDDTSHKVKCECECV